MGLPEFLATAWKSGIETMAYLFAYGYVLVLAPGAHLALLALGPGRRIGLESRRGPFAATVLGLTEPLSRSAFERNLRRLETPGAAVAYLGTSHALTAYTWLLLGPLLGKDFLLSHAVGVSLFVLIAGGLLRLAGISGPSGSEKATPDGRGMPHVVLGALVRFGWLAALGLALGGLVAAWGLSEWSWAPAEVGGGGGWTQLAGGSLGLALALLGVPPVADLFVGTYLWKVGLTHAGIVAFFCASTAAPTRWGIYSRLYGRRGAVGFVGALLVAALLAGLVTAWVFGALDLTIRYKLLPEQLWEVS